MEFGGKCCKGGIYSYNLKSKNKQQDGEKETFPMHWNYKGLTMLNFSKGGLKL